MRDGSVTTADAALLAGVAPATIRSWVHRGLLEPERRWRRSNIFTVSAVWKAECLARNRDTTGSTRPRR